MRQRGQGWPGLRWAPGLGPWQEGVRQAGEEVGLEVEWGGFLSRKGKVKIISPGEETGVQRREET